MSADPLVGKKIHIGGQTRTLKYTFKALRVLQKRIGNITIKQAVGQMDVDYLVEFAAAGFFGGGDMKVSADSVTAWLENEPALYVPLLEAVTTALTEAYSRMTPKEVEPGEAPPPTTETPAGG